MDGRPPAGERVQNARSEDKWPDCTVGDTGCNQELVAVPDCNPMLLPLCDSRGLGPRAQAHIRPAIQINNGLDFFSGRQILSGSWPMTCCRAVRRFVQSTRVVNNLQNQPPERL